MSFTRRPPAAWLRALSVLFVQTAVAAGPADAVDPPPRPLVFGVNRIGDAGVLHHPPDYDEHMYRRIREAGGTCVRLAASPRDIEAVRGRRDWTDFDRDLALAIKYEQEPVVLIVNTPAWASPTGEADHLYPYKTELLGEFADFCADLARRTRGKVRLFQLWNEQNGCGWHFVDGFNHADEYLPVLAACRAGLKKGNPDAVLALGGLDDAEGHAPIFLRKTYEECAARDIRCAAFDAVGDHPYSDTPAIMRGKLDALRAIMKGHGDAGKPFWITEYGWHTGNLSPAAQAEHVGAILRAFTTPDWADLQLAIYLSIADFEGGADGFGLTDANLRPKPAFHAFQAAPRFGAYPPYEIDGQFAAADKLTIEWKTLEPTTGTVELAPANKLDQLRRAESPLGTQHRVAFESLAPETDYRFHVETSRSAPEGEKTYRSADYALRSPGPKLRNGDFESGFFAGIGDGRRIDGQGFCTDAALLPDRHVTRGEHTQAVFAHGGGEGRGGIDSTLSTVIAAEPGWEITFTFACAAKTGIRRPRVLVRAGVEPRGRFNPASEDIAWTPWATVARLWTDHTVAGEARNTVVRLFIQCRSEGDPGDDRVIFLLDDVRVGGDPDASGG